MNIIEQTREVQVRVGVHADGIWGPATRSKVASKLGVPIDDRAIQRAVGVAAEGQVGIQTLTALLGRLAPRAVPTPAADLPGWVTVARALIGTREIVGPQHNSWISKGWARLGAGWFNDDETPWCGYFVAHCMDAVGLPYPKGGRFASAAAWGDYGMSASPQLGAIGVKKRKGGNHVFFIVGETADRAFYKALGGNQGNCVSIIDIRKSDVFAVRWPAGVPQPHIPLPVMARGTTNASEA